MIPRSSDVFATTNANSPHALIAHPMVKNTVGLGKSTWGGDGPKTPVTTFPRSATRRRAANPTTSKVHKSLTGTLKATEQEKKILSIHVSILFTWECHTAFCVGERSRESTIEKERRGCYAYLDLANRAEAQAGEESPEEEGGFAIKSGVHQSNGKEELKKESMENARQ